MGSEAGTARPLEPLRLQLVELRRQSALEVCDSITTCPWATTRFNGILTVLRATFDLAAERMTIRGNPIHRTKNSEIRKIPLFTSTKQLLERPGNRDPNAHIIQNHEVRRALRSACRAAGIAPLSHHDFRHLFAARCIESGVDIPTASRWLGHEDGGALAMRTYGHLRDEHSRQQAKKVKFRELRRPGR